MKNVFAGLSELLPHLPWQPPITDDAEQGLNPYLVEPCLLKMSTELKLKLNVALIAECIEDMPDDDEERLKLSVNFDGNSQPLTVKVTKAKHFIYLHFSSPNDALTSAIREEMIEFFSVQKSTFPERFQQAV